MTGKINSCEEWTLINADVFMHPFHIHVNPFQVTEVNGVAVKDIVWWDTAMLPPNGKLKIRTRYRKDVTGLTVFHCHFLPHEDNGMMTLFELVR